MKVSGFLCGCARTVVQPRDHYDSGACPDPPFPLEWINAILDRNEGDERHAGGNITATRLLGCPRAALLLDERPVPVDVKRLHSAAFGHEWHDLMAARRGASLAKVVIPATELFGVQVSGEVDKVAPDWSTITDWKVHGETAQRMKHNKRKAGGVDRDLAAQLNIYRILIARSILKVPDDEYRPTMVGWHLAMVSAEPHPSEPPPTPRGKSGWVPDAPVPPGVQVVCPVMTEAEIARHRPLDDDRSPGTQPYTVREIVKMYVDFRAARVGGMAFDQALRTHVPLVGRNIFGGKQCLRYCAALPLCDKVEGVQR